MSHRVVSGIAGFGMALVFLLEAAPAYAQPTFVAQGDKWDSAQRKDFYSRDQGSRIMPLAWMAALKQPNGDPFMANSLARYGYLPNPDALPAGIPVGFTVASQGDDQTIGMNCSACHTRQIEVAGTQYRIDGGPGIADFQSFLTDLDAAVQNVLTNPTVFSGFADGVLGPNSAAAQKTALRQSLTAWQLPFHTLITRALPKQPWGVGRLDAVSMIFNRLTGLDLGPAPSYVIAGNISIADAPVRYPFLWNAARQDMTQWPGFAQNGNNLLGLARNTGEVFGVFGTFHPKKRLALTDYLNGSSINFQGLDALEDTIRRIGKPQWPFPVDPALAAKGKELFSRDMPGGSCASCHGIQPGAFRPALPTEFQETWKTQTMDVGTDSRQHGILDRKVNPGVLLGSSVPLGAPLAASDTAFNVLKVSVINSIVQHAVRLPLLGLPGDAAVQATQNVATQLNDAFHRKPATAVGQFPYESRVLEGIWAAAPYLHNGSVPSLAELLKPAAQRVSSFTMGPEYDLKNVGIAATQTKLTSTMTTTDCSQRDSGNSRCGHEFGTTLSDDDKAALLEYLKTI